MGSAAPDFDLPGVDDRNWKLKDFADAKALVVLFTCNHCPTAQYYEERIKQLVNDYKGRGVALVAISPNDPKSVRLDELGWTDLSDTFEEMKLRAKDREYNYPYLYDGDPAYEARYLRTYTRTADSLFVLAIDGDRVVGASTCLPLAQEEAAFQQPFLERGMAVEDVFYCGESVLLPEYRGRGIGHRFFDEREAHAQRLGRFDLTAFAAVDRASDDARRPPQHRDNDVFWDKRGYVRQPGMTMRLAWKELGEANESEKALTFWLRRLPAPQPFSDSVRVAGGVDR